MPFFIIGILAALGMAAFFKPPVKKEKHPLPPLPPRPDIQVPPFIPPEGLPPFIPEGQIPPGLPPLDFPPTAPPFPFPEPIKGTEISWMSGDKSQIVLERPFVEDDSTDVFSYGRMLFEEALHSFDPAIIEQTIEDLNGRLDHRIPLGWSESEIGTTAAMQSVLRMVLALIAEEVPPENSDLLPEFYEQARRAIDTSVQDVEDVIAEYQHELWNPTQALRIIARWFTPFIPQGHPGELLQMYQHPKEFGISV